LLLRSPRPERLDRSPAPFVHAATRKIQKELWEAYGWFVAAYREAADKLRKGDRDAAFPPGSFPPSSAIRAGLSHSSI
jgi:hypothetical protein